MSPYHSVSFLFPFYHLPRLGRNHAKVKRDKISDHRITEQLRVEGNSGGHLIHPSAQAGPPRTSSGSYPGGFWVPARMETLHPLWVACFYAWLHSEWKSVSRRSDAASSVSVCYLLSCPWHHWKEPGITLKEAKTRYNCLAVQLEAWLKLTSY